MAVTVYRSRQQQLSALHKIMNNEKLRDRNELRSGNMTSQFFFSVYPETSWRIQMLMMLLQFYWMAGGTALHEWSVKQMIAWIHLL